MSTRRLSKRTTAALANAVTIAMEYGARCFVGNHTEEFSDLVVVSRALALVESRPGFDWDDQANNRATVCAAIAGHVASGALPRSRGHKKAVTRTAKAIVEIIATGTLAHDHPFTAGPKYGLADFKVGPVVFFQFRLDEAPSLRHLRDRILAAARNLQARRPKTHAFKVRIDRKAIGVSVQRIPVTK